MSFRGLRGRRPSLLVTFGVLSALPILLLCLVLGRHLEHVIEERAFASAEQTTSALANFAVPAFLDEGSGLDDGLSATEIRRIDATLNDGLTKVFIPFARIWSRGGELVYTNTQPPAGPRPSAPAGVARAALGFISSSVVEVGDRRLLRVFAPIQAGGFLDEPLGVVDISVPYASVAATISRDTRRAYLVMIGGFALLYALLFPIVARASKRLRRHAVETERKARHDELTGLGNRTLFAERVDEALDERDRDGGTLAVLVMDLDRFKEVNDTLGHHAGDLLLERVAERLQGVVRDGDAVARLGGDEFAVLLPRVTDAEYALATAARIRAELERPFQVEGLEVDSPPSIGVALFPDHGVDLETLLRHGDVAMYAAKARQGGIEIYRPEHDRLSPDRLSLVAELRRAIDESELVVYYQPKADLLTGEVSAVEALVRWAHPERGLVPPDEFIAIAEQTGLIRPLAAFVLEESLRQCAAWAAEGLELDVSVNLSARNLDDAELPDQVAALLERTGVPAHRLQLEITETTLMGDPARAKQVLGRLDAMGIGLSLDDFGIGSSSLAYLRELPFAELKIDRSFVQRMAAEENYALIVRTTIAMSQGLGLRVVAEGVETEEVWGLLADLGCDQAQGYVLTRPIPATELRAWIQARSDRAAA